MAWMGQASGACLCHFFLFQQLFNAPLSPAAALPGGVLNLVAAVAVPLALLGRVPELAMQTLGAIQKAAPKQFLRCGLDLLLQFCTNRAFFLDFIRHYAA